MGSHAWDRARNLIYANMPTATENNVLHVLDTDNLTVRERIQIRENLTGKSLMSSDDSDHVLRFRERRDDSADRTTVRHAAGRRPPKRMCSSRRMPAAPD